MATPDPKNPKAATTASQNGMDRTSLQTASSWSNIVVVVLAVLAAIAGVFALNTAGVVLAVLAAIAGALALYFSSRLGALKDADFVRFQLESTERIAVANSEAAKANERAAEANRKAEEERLARVELEKAFSPRSAGDQLSFATKLKPFAGTQMIVETLADVEVSRLAGQIAFVFQMADWKIVSASKMLDDTLFTDGVTVGANTAPWNEEGQLMQDDTGPAANVLVAELKAREVEAVLALERDLPRHTIRIRVGLKPTRYFWSKEIK